MRVLFFGVFRERSGLEALELEGGISLEELKGYLMQRFPFLKEQPFLVAVNHRVVSGNPPLGEEDEVALLPPLAGGSGAGIQVASRFLTRAPISSEVIEGIRARGHPGCGSLVLFEGRVRADTREGKRVERILYEAYEPMAEKVFEEILKEAKGLFPVEEAVALHRLGEVEVGEVALLVAVFSGHRKEGFEALLYLVEEIKKRVPIWKKEILSDGEGRWVQG